MNINRQNYEEYFLLYVDHELTDSECREVLAFVELNPDLKGELLLLQQSVFRADEQQTFTNKDELFRKENSSGFIHAGNCEEFFILYADQELNEEQRKEVDTFIQLNPSFQPAFELFQQATLTPDEAIIFPDKKVLYREEKTRRVVFVRWQQVAVAAALLFIAATTVWFTLLKEEPAGNDPKQAVAVKDRTTVKDLTTQNKKTDTTQVNDQNENSDVDQRYNPITSSDQTDKNKGQSISSSSKAIISNKNSTQEKQPVAERQQLDLAAADRTAVQSQSLPVQKNDQTESNLVKASGVILSDAGVPNRVVSGADKIDRVEATKLTATPVDQSITTGSMASIEANDPELDQFVQEPPRNKKMRGLLRRVTRVLEKATNSEQGENGKNNIRIASFSIAVN